CITSVNKITHFVCPPAGNSGGSLLCKLNKLESPISRLLTKFTVPSFENTPVTHTLIAPTGMALAPVPSRVSGGKLKFTNADLGGGDVCMYTSLLKGCKLVGASFYELFGRGIACACYR